MSSERSEGAHSAADSNHAPSVEGAEEFESAQSGPEDHE